MANALRSTLWWIFSAVIWFFSVVGWIHIVLAVLYTSYRFLVHIDAAPVLEHLVWAQGAIDPVLDAIFKD